jgi:hypothetical protein
MLLTSYLTHTVSTIPPAPTQTQGVLLRRRSGGGGHQRAPHETAGGEETTAVALDRLDLLEAKVCV